MDRTYQTEVEPCPTHCPICGVLIPLGTPPFWRLARHIDDRHCRRSNRYLCPCGFAGSLAQAAGHLAQQDDLTEHLMLGVLGR